MWHIGEVSTRFIVPEGDSTAGGDNRVREDKTFYDTSCSQTNRWAARSGTRGLQAWSFVCRKALFVGCLATIHTGANEGFARGGLEHKRMRLQEGSRRRCGSVTSGAQRGGNPGQRAGLVGPGHGTNPGMDGIAPDVQKVIRTREGEMLSAFPTSRRGGNKKVAWDGLPTSRTIASTSQTPRIPGA